jgi:nitrile hydratase
MATATTILFTAEQTATIIGRAWKDPSFKQALLENPASALAQFLDFHLPPGFSLTVAEETATALYFVLPASAEAANNRDRPAIEAQIVARALHDGAFREALLADPTAALQEHFGMFLPETITVRVCEESATRRYLVLPLDPSSAVEEHEMTDLELMTVAGGGRTYRPNLPSCQVVNGMGRAPAKPTLAMRRRAQRC